MQNTGQTTDKPLSLPWDFVKRFFPNFENSDEIRHEENLNKLLNGEYEDGDDAEKLLHAFYEDDLENPQILIDHRNALVKIYETAIENMMKTGFCATGEEISDKLPEGLEPEAAREYIESPHTCPFCKSENLEATNQLNESGKIFQRVDCFDCEHNWHDIYILAGVENRL